MPGNAPPQIGGWSRGSMPTATRRCCRGWRRPLVFDDPVDLARLAAYLPAAGRARIVITSTALSATSLGTPIPVGVFSLGQAASYLAERTGLEDDGAARAVAGELGCLPLALAQAGGVIAAQRI